MKHALGSATLVDCPKTTEIKTQMDCWTTTDTTN